MKNTLKKLTEADFRTSIWSGGKTTQLFIYPENSNYNTRDFKVRVSSATVELAESNFTKLEGVHRFIAPLDGNLSLTHDGKAFVDLKPFEIYEFEGDLETKSFGKVTDFNLMLVNGAKGELESFPIPEGKELRMLLNNGITILYSYSSTLRIWMDEEEVTLHPNELLSIKSAIANHIKVQSDKDANILVSRMLE